MVRYQDIYCYDVCCLGHVDLGTVQNPLEAFRLMSRFLVRATFAKTSDPRQQVNVQRNRRIGVGFFGYHNWLAKNRVRYSDAPTKEEVKRFFEKMKNAVVQAAKEYAHQLRIPGPIKHTTIAPTGSISTLPGSVSAAQCAFAKYYIRRVRYSDSDDELAKKREEGYKVETDRYSANTSVVEYVAVDPLFGELVELLKLEERRNSESPKEEQELDQWAKALATSLLEDQNEISLEDALETQQMLQTYYADNAISITLNVDPARYSVEQVKNILRKYLPHLKGVTLFPEWSMPQAPLERLSPEQFEARQSAGEKVEVTQVEQSCLNGACPIR